MCLYKGPFVLVQSSCGRPRASTHCSSTFLQVSNVESGVSYRFNVINCEKPNSQFNSGMQPLLFSVTEARNGQAGWRRTGGNIWYHKNSYVYEATEHSSAAVCPRGDKGVKTVRKNFFTLSFSVKFQHSGDECYLVYHYPYTYSMLQVQIT